MSLLRRADRDGVRLDEHRRGNRAHRPERPGRRRSRAARATVRASRRRSRRSSPTSSASTSPTCASSQGDTDATPFGARDRRQPQRGDPRRRGARSRPGRFAQRIARSSPISSRRHPTTSRSSTARVHVRGTPTKGMTIAEIATQAYTEPGGAAARRAARPRERRCATRPSSFVTWSNACHMCVVRDRSPPPARSRSCATSSARTAA